MLRKLIFFVLGIQLGIVLISVTATGVAGQQIARKRDVNSFPIYTDSYHLFDK